MVCRVQWALNNLTFLIADIRAVRSAKHRKPRTVLKTTSVTMEAFRIVRGQIRSEYLNKQSEYKLLLNCWIIYPIGPS